jgi:transposase
MFFLFLDVYLNQMYPPGFKVAALRAYQNMQSYRKVAHLLGVSVGIVHKWNEQNYSNTRHIRIKPKLTYDMLVIIRKFVAQKPHCTLSEIRQICGLSKNTVSSALKLLSITRKRAGKPLHGRASQESLLAFYKSMYDFMQDSHRPEMWSVDECYFSERICPLFVYCKRGTKIRPTVTSSSWKQHTLLLGMSDRGGIEFEIFPGSCVRTRFKAFVTRLPGRVICDNASIHKKLEMPNVGFVPPYSPEYNPVEMAFSVIKGAFRVQDIHQTTGRQSVSERIHRSIQNLTPTKARSMFRHVYDLILHHKEVGGINQTPTR